MSRRHVLGDLYSRCETVVNVPVYLDNKEGEMLGYVDQGLGHYADAFSFHLPEEVCKKLSAGYFTFAFDLDYADPAAAPGRAARPAGRRACGGCPRRDEQGFQRRRA